MLATNLQFVSPEGVAALAGPLRKLEVRNLSSPTPHPLFSMSFHFHPTLLERVQVLQTESV